MDTEEKIIGLYEERSGVTPEFPIVDFSGGGRDIAMLFGFAAGGQAHMMHPDLEFERIPSATDTPYKKEYMIPGIQAALNDDCETGGGTTYTLSVNSGSGDGEHGEDATITIIADDAPAGQVFNKWTGDVDYLDDPNMSTTIVTMPAKDIAVTATYKKAVKKDNYMVVSTWEAGLDTIGSSVTIDSSLKADTILTSVITLGKSDEANKKWAWAQISGYAAGDFSNVTSVELTYSSNNPINLVLDQEGLSAGGASYYYKLPAATRGNIIIPTGEFKQPDWVKTDAPDLVADLTLSKVGSISFAAVKEEATTTIEIKGIYLEGYQETPIISKSGLLSQNELVKVSNLTANKLVLSKAKKGNYNISIFNISGKKIYSTQKCLEGPTIVNFKNGNLTNGSYIIKISSEAGTLISNRILK